MTRSALQRSNGKKGGAGFGFSLAEPEKNKLFKLALLAWHAQLHHRRFVFCVFFCDSTIITETHGCRGLTGHCIYVYDRTVK
jgi:hypothetical protein